MKQSGSLIVERAPRNVVIGAVLDVMQVSSLQLRKSSQFAFSCVCQTSLQAWQYSMLISFFWLLKIDCKAPQVSENLSLFYTENLLCSHLYRSIYCLSDEQYGRCYLRRWSLLEPCYGLCELCFDNMTNVAGLERQSLIEYTVLLI